MPKFKIQISRTSVGFTKIIIDADDKEAAILKADDAAGDQIYIEKQAEYEIQGVSEIPDDVASTAPAL